MHMKRKHVLRQAIIDLSPDPSTTIFNRSPASLAPKLKTELLTTQHDIDNPVIGTGIFAHNATEAIPYDLLLQRLFLQENHFPSLNTYGENEGNVVKPYIVAMGKKRTIFANFQDVHKSIKRDKSHVAQFIFRELGTSGSFDEHERLFLKGRFVSQHIDNVVRRYDVTYVKCSSCNSTNTDLRKTDYRAMLVTCNVCGMENIAPAIKTGYAQMIPKRRRRKEISQKEPESVLETINEPEVMHGPGSHCFADFVVKSRL